MIRLGVLVVFCCIWHVVNSQQCPEGQFSADGSEPCDPCSSGESTNGAVGATMCTACDEGKYAESSGTGACTPCAPGAIASSQGLDTCTSCCADELNCGLYQPNSGESTCVVVLKGHHSQSPYDNQVPCQEGSYQPQDGQSECIACPVGKYADGTASIECDVCPPGTGMGLSSNEGQISQAACVACSPGRYMFEWVAPTEQEPCLACPAGKYATLSGQTVCTTCDPNGCIGSTGEDAGACAAGFSGVGDNGGTCDACEPGTYKAKSGNEACTSCDPNASGCGGTSEGVCKDGYNSSNDDTLVCIACPEGTYDSGSSCVQVSDGQCTSYDGESCAGVGSVAAVTYISCPKGTYHGSQTGKGSVCVEINAGSCASDDGTSCIGGINVGASRSVLCPPGRYSSESASTECTGALPGTCTSNDGGSTCIGDNTAGATSVRNCPTGRYGPNAEATTCVPSSAGMCPSSDNITCGTTGATGEIDCSPGKYSPGDSTCLICTQGKYSEFPKAESCTFPGQGFCSSVDGSTCDANPGAIAQAACPAGTVDARESYSLPHSACQACAAGEYAQDVTKCADCPAGTSSSSSSSACTTCEEGKYSLGKAQNCDTVTEGFCASIDGTSCAESPSVGATAELQCPSGAYSVGDSNVACSLCGPGKSSVAGGSSCFACPNGKFSDIENHSSYFTSLYRCVDADEGYCSSDGQVCLSSSDGATTQSLCVPGKYATGTGNSNCVDCNPGEIAPSAGAATCDPCSSGTYIDIYSGTVCSTVLKGYCASTANFACVGVGGTGADSKLACPAGRFSSQEGSVECTEGAPGYCTHIEDGGTTCNNVDGSASTSEAPCPAGRYSTGGQSSCTVCPDGWYSKGIANEACIDTPPGYEAILDGTDFAECEIGTANPSNSGTCSACASGTFTSAAASETCESIPSGNYGVYQGSLGDQGGATGYLPCPVGTSASTGVTNVSECLPCPEGTYQSTEGESSCAAVPPGFYASDSVNGKGASEIKECPAGKYSTVGASSLDGCQACEKGKFGAAIAMSECEPAAAGYYVTAEGLTEQSPCEVNTFSSGGAEVCTQCSPGSDTAGNDASETCTPCAKGRYADTAGGDCEACPAGKATYDDGATEFAACESCPASYYTPSPGDACVSCPESRGYRGVSDSLNDCKSCPDGQYYFFNDTPFTDLPPNDAGVSNCQTCSIGRYISENAAEYTNVAITSSVGTGARATVRIKFGTVNYLEITDVGDANYLANSVLTIFHQDIGGNSVDVDLKFTTLTAPLNEGDVYIVDGASTTDVSISSNPDDLPRLFVCIECDAGKSVGDGVGKKADDCYSCPSHSYAYHQPLDKSGSIQTPCVSCSAGTYALEGSSVCTNCVEGKYSTPSSSYSTPDEACLWCGPGTSVGAGLGTNATDCINCETGKYNTGQSPCLSCEVGKFGEVEGLTSCLGCPSGTYADTLGSVECLSCPVGSFYKRADDYIENNIVKYDYSIAGAEICTSCPGGTISTEEGASACSPCPVGSAAPEGSTVCTLCPLSYYNDSPGAPECTICPGGRLTPFEGATDLKQCVSPGTNFITGFVVVAFLVPFSMEYVIHARYHRVAFLRYERITRKLVARSRSLMVELGHYTIQALAERRRDLSYRALKTWAFLLSGILLQLLVSLLTFMTTMMGVFFKSMILWRGMKIDFPFMKTIADAVKELSIMLKAQFLEYLFVPMEVIFNALAELKIDLSAVNVTCKGALSPIEIMFNLIILGITILVIESDYQLFRAISLNSLTDKFLLVVSQQSYVTWLKNTGTVGKSRFSYAGTIMLAMLARALGTFDFMQSFLQYLMSLVVLEKFVDLTPEDPLLFWRHEASPECNGVTNYIQFDNYIATIASAEAWFLFIPMIYELSKVLIPGIPKNVKAIDDVEKKRDPKSSMLRKVKYLGLLTPDLWFASWSNSWIDTVKARTPADAGKISSNVLAIEMKRNLMHDLRKFNDALRINVELLKDEENQNHEDDTFGEKEHSSQIIKERQEIIYHLSQELEKTKRKLAAFKGNKLESKSMKLHYQKNIFDHNSEKREAVNVNAPDSLHTSSFRVVSKGTYANHPRGDAPGFYQARPRYTVKVWAHYPLVHSGDYVLVKIHRESGCISIQSYDVGTEGKACDGRSGKELAAALNEAEENELVVVYTNGNPRPNRLKNGLPKAMIRCGASPEKFGNNKLFEEDCAYVLIGVGGCGVDAGFQLITKREDAVMDISFDLKQDGFILTNISCGGGTDAKKCFNYQSPVLSTLHERTAEENLNWKQRQKESMPSYFTLIRLEYEAMLEAARSSFLCSVCCCLKPVIWFPCLLMSVLGIGHFTTEIGRRAWYVVGWKLLKFFQVALGNWDDDLVEIFKIHENVRALSVVWEKPVKKRKKEAYDTYRKTIALGTSEETVENDIEFGTTKKNKKKIFLKSFPGSEYELPAESPEQEDLQQEELKRKLRYDYSMCLAAQVTTRVVLLQIVPQFTLISIYSSIMSYTPLSVRSESLLRNLPENFISKPFLEARAQEQETIDDSEWVRQFEMTEDMHCLPNPKTKRERNPDRVVEISEDQRKIIDLDNQKIRDSMREILKQPARTVNEWMVLCNGFCMLILESRSINFFLNLYKFALTVGVLLTDSKYLYYWMLSALVVVAPYSLVIGLKVFVALGVAMDITDEDLMRALGSVGLGACFKGVLWATGSTKSAYLDEDEGNTKTDRLGGDENFEGDTDVDHSSEGDKVVQRMQIVEKGIIVERKKQRARSLEQNDAEYQILLDKAMTRSSFDQFEDVRNGGFEYFDDENDSGVSSGVSSVQTNLRPDEAVKGFEHFDNEDESSEAAKGFEHLDNEDESSEAAKGFEHFDNEDESVISEDSSSNPPISNSGDKGIELGEIKPPSYDESRTLGSSSADMPPPPPENDEKDRHPEKASADALVHSSEFSDNESDDESSDGDVPPPPPDAVVNSSGPTNDDGDLHGGGCFIKYSDGSSYSGDMFKGKKHGTGVLKRDDGSSYEGQFFNDLEQGKGVLKDSDGKTLKKGKFIAGKFIK